MSIKAVRTQAGLTQQALSDASGVAREQINKYENGRRIPDLRNLIRLKIALGCTLDELVEEDDTEGRSGC